MPREAENSDHSTLSLPELDPLLNPILAQNMSRWAAVYFASAPENREKAVLELLRQLEAEEAARENGVPLPAFVALHDSAPKASSDSLQEEAHALFVDCQACGQENPADNSFCSMCGSLLEKCGALLENQPPASGQRIQTQEVPQAEPVVPVENQRSNFSQPAPAINEPAVTSRESSRVPTYREVRSSNHAPRFGRYSEPASNSYRAYIVAAIAVLAPALIFMAWRGRQATSKSAPAVTQDPSTVTEQPAPPAPIQSIPTQTAAAAEVPPAPPANVPAASSPGAAEKITGKAATGNGSEELAIALSYLSGTDGKQRNSEEAMQWLWKAVAKRNADATLRLSDLYLRGDGVAKNCDQARVLLDAAASRGISGAADRLRHLQSFGCE